MRVATKDFNYGAEKGDILIFLGYGYSDSGEYVLEPSAVDKVYYNLSKGIKFTTGPSFDKKRSKKL